MDILMKAQERLQKAQVAAREGRYEEALREHLWFHEHALEEEPSLYGVRLSFALADWVKLAKVYPEARRALEEIRDRKTAILLQGEGDRESFHDVCSTNGYLHREDLTSDLFAKIAALFPDLAEQCADLALPALVKAGDFRLARRFVPVPAEALRRFSGVLNSDVEDLANRPPSGAPVLDAYVQIYAQRVVLLAAILHGVGETTEAKQVIASALELIESQSVREAVRTVLRPPKE